MYIAPEQGQTNSWGPNFDVNRKALSFWSIVECFKKMTLKSDLIIFLMFSCTYIAPRQGQTTLWWQSFDVNRKPRSLWPFVASFKMTSLNSDFIHIFKIILYMYMYTAPGQGQTNPWGQNFDVNRKLLPLRPFVASLKNNLFEFWFYAHFLMFFLTYIAPGPGQTTLCGQNSDVNRKAWSLCQFAASFKKYLWSLILYIFLPVFIHVYSPGAGADNTLRSEFLL